MDKKELILNSVLSLVNRVGFYHLSMKKIAEESNISPGTIYLYFKGKEELINAIYELVLRQFNEAVIEGFDEESSIKDNFFKMMEKALLFHINNEDKFSFIEQFTFAPFLFKENKKQNFILLLPLFKLFADAKDKNVIRQIPNEVILSIIHGSLNTIVKLHLSNKYDLNNNDNLNIFVESIWNSIAIE